jgi:hypothetical protein
MLSHVILRPAVRLVTGGLQLARHFTYRKKEIQFQFDIIGDVM